MANLVSFLYGQFAKDGQLALQLTLLELPNLLALLDWITDQAQPEEVVQLASQVEQLLANLGRPLALARATHVREEAARALEEWSHAQFLAEWAGIDRLQERGDVQAARGAAQQLLQRCLAAGEAAYLGATYDIAMAHLLLGRVLKDIGAVEAALTPLAEARRRFETLAGEGSRNAERMAAVTFLESGICLIELGRLDEAVAVHEAAIKHFEKFDDRTWIAVSKGNLGTVHMRQGRYDEALKAHIEARELFAALGEPRQVATAWHQIGIVHREAGQYEQAERAYRQGLAIRVQHGDRAGEADSLGELGNLYDAMERLEEATTFYRQTADLCVRLQNLEREGRARGNLGNVLIKLRRYDEARRELERAIECNKPYGHAAQPWTTWAILHDLEQATGNAQAAIQARARAVAAYLAYRRAGGESQMLGAQLCALVAQGITQGDMTGAEKQLTELLGADIPNWAKTLIPKLQAILRGSRDAALAADPALDYDDAAELLLLLEGLGGMPGA